MDNVKRVNQGYEIIESRTIGSTEFVIGHNPNAPNPYVCWHYKNGTDYFWGVYCNSLEGAREKMNERAETEVAYQRDKKQIPPKVKADHER